MTRPFTMGRGRRIQRLEAASPGRQSPKMNESVPARKKTTANGGKDRSVGRGADFLQAGREKAGFF